jgi:hypothetical protein
MPQIICAFLLIALALVTVFHKYRGIMARPRMVTGFALTALVTAVCLQPLPYYNYCRQACDTNNSNKVPLKVIKVVLSAPKGQSIVLLDGNLPLVNQPLPTLLALSQQRFVMLPDLTRQSDSWERELSRNGNKEVIAILSQSSFNHLKPEITAQEIHSLSYRAVVPKILASPQTIYVVKINGKSNIMGSTKVSSHKTDTLGGEVK